MCLFSGLSSLSVDQHTAFITYAKTLLASATDMADNFKYAVVCVLLLHLPDVLFKYPGHILNITMLDCDVSKDVLLMWSTCIKEWFWQRNGLYMELASDETGVGNTVPVACFKDFMDKSIAVQQANNLAMCSLRDNSLTLTRSVQDLTELTGSLTSGMQTLMSHIHELAEVNHSLREELVAIRSAVKKRPRVSAADSDSELSEEVESGPHPEVVCYNIIYHNILLQHIIICHIICFKTGIKIHQTRSYN